MSDSTRTGEVRRRVRAWRAGGLPVSNAFLLWTFTAFLATFGLVMTLSSSTVLSLSKTGSAYSIFTRQLVWVGAGFVAMAVTSSVPTVLWRKLAMPLFIACCVALALVLVPGIGISVDGSARWLGVGALRMQPSEFAKIAVILVCAVALERRQRALDDPMEFVVPVLFPYLAIIGVLLMLEPDFGTTLIVTGIVIYLLYLAEARLPHLFTICGAGVALAGVLSMAAPYRRARMLSFLDPWKDAGGAGYQVVQGLIAIGSGGATGMGLGASRQKWDLLPNAHTDFIFAIVAEELGLIGVAVLCVLLFGLVLFCARAARRAPDTFGTLVAGGVGAWLGAQAIMNLGAVTSLLPVDGVPLPLMSVGGSNALVLMAALGIVVAVAREGDQADARAERTRRRRDESVTDLREFV